MELTKCLKWSSRPRMGSSSLSISVSQLYGVRAMDHYAWLLTWVLGTITQIFILEEQALYPLCHILRPSIDWFFLFYFILLYLLYVCYVGTWTTAHARKKEGNFQKSVLSFNHVDPRDWTQIVRLGGKFLYPFNDQRNYLESWYFCVFDLIYVFILHLG